MLLRDALPRFYAEALAAIATRPDDELATVGRETLLSQFEKLALVEPVDPTSGSFHVTSEGRQERRDYSSSFDFDIPSGNAIDDLDSDLQIVSFEPISPEASADRRAQLAQLASRRREP